MTGTNHFLTGSLVGLTVHQPVLAIVLAFGSHFVLDALPHFGEGNHTGRKFLTILGLDAVCITLVLLMFAITQPAYWALAVACGLAAASPDLMWLSNWLREMLGRAKRPHNNAVERFHGNIQWAEKAKNWPFEAVWVIAGLILLVKIT
ncbi:MAG: hypothetical protein V4702_00745 [Patescibacteria group bacterium]